MENPVLSGAGNTTAAAGAGDQGESSRKKKRNTKMQKMEKKANLLVTFSKRRTGLFRKASEMSTLCGVQLALIVFSPGRKAFSFGYPSVDEIVDRYLLEAAAPNTAVQQRQEAYNSKDNVVIAELIEELTKLLAALKTEKGRGRIIGREAHRSSNWWENPVEEMNMEKLLHMESALECAKDEVLFELNKSVGKYNK